MTADTASTLSNERRQIVAILLLAAVVVVALGLAWLRPLYGQLSATRAQIHQVDRDIRAFSSRNSVSPLVRQIAEAKAEHERLLLEWSDLRARTDTFRGWPSLLQKLPKLEDGRIDFKVALFSMQARLQEGATNRGATLTADLGMPETLDTGERPGTRLWQLATTVKWVEQALALGIPAIDRLQAQRPCSYDVLDEPDTVVREFPVEVTLQCSYDQLLRLLDNMLQSGKYFALRGIRMEIKDRAVAPRLTVTAICGGVLFQLRDAADGVSALPAPVSG
jgi:hypothetical protein